MELSSGRTTAIVIFRFEGYQARLPLDTADVDDMACFFVSQ